MPTGFMFVYLQMSRKILYDSDNLLKIAYLLIFKIPINLNVNFPFVKFLSKTAELVHK